MNRFMIELTDYIISFVSKTKNYYIIRDKANDNNFLITRINFNKSLSCLNFSMFNVGNVTGSENILKGVYETLLTNEDYLNAGSTKVIMLIARHEETEFSYHPNVYLSNNTSFEDYYKNVKDNITHL